METDKVRAPLVEVLRRSLIGWQRSDDCALTIEALDALAARLAEAVEAHEYEYVNTVADERDAAAGLLRELVAYVEDYQVGLEGEMPTPVAKARVFLEKLISNNPETGLADERDAARRERDKYLWELMEARHLRDDAAALLREAIKQRVVWGWHAPEWQENARAFLARLEAQK